MSTLTSVTEPGIIPLYTKGDTLDDVLQKLADNNENGKRKNKNKNKNKNTNSDIILNSDSSIALPNTQKDGFSPIFRNAAATGVLTRTLHPDINTGVDLWKHAVSKHGTKDYLGSRSSAEADYEFFTYEQVDDLQKKLGSGILHILRKRWHDEYRPINNFVLSIYAPNRWEWVVLDIMSQSFSITSTSLYDTLGPTSTGYILKLTESPVIALTKSKIESTLTLINDHRNDIKVKIMISMDKLDPNEDLHLYNLAKSLDVLLYDFDEVIKIGSIHPHAEITPTEDTVFTISFTSGTSGTPKGVMLTQKNLISGVTGLYARLNKDLSASKHFALLPLAHVVERAYVFFIIAAGGSYYFPHNPTNVKTFFEDICKIKPTDIGGVPRIYNKLETSLRSKLYPSNPDISTRLAQRAVEYKLSKFRDPNAKPEDAKHFFYDNFIHPKLRRLIGFDNVSLLSTGSAPIASDTLQFIRAVFNIPFFYQGYGATETFGGVSMNLGNFHNPRDCGPVHPTMEFKLEDVLDMGYSYERNRSGEILFRGNQIAKGYFKSEEETAKAFDQDGWYHTGDIVRLDDKGWITIIDRRKNFFKLAQGEYIAPEKIENIYLSKNADLISQIWVYGDSLQPYLVAVVGVDRDSLTEFLLKSKLKIDEFDSEDYDSVRSLFDNAKFKKLILSKLNRSVAKELQGFEKIKNVYIDFEPLKVENGTITPTLKIKRNVAKKVFKRYVDELYSYGELLATNAQL